MNLQNIVENRLSENPQPPLVRIETKLQQTSVSLNALNQNLSRWQSDWSRQENRLLSRISAIEAQVNEEQKNISRLMTFSRTANEAQRSTMQAVLKAARSVSMGWSFKVLMAVNTILNIGTMVMVLYLIQILSNIIMEV